MLHPTGDHPEEHPVRRGAVVSYCLALGHLYQRLIYSPAFHLGSNYFNPLPSLLLFEAFACRK